MNEGYTTPDGRHIYALLYELETDPPACRQLVVPLDSHGDSTSPKIAPCEPNKRVVTTQPGEFILFDGKRVKVAGIGVYR